MILPPSTRDSLSIDLLLALLSLGDGQNFDARLHLATRADWDDIVELAIFHQLAPLLYKRLSGKIMGLSQANQQRLSISYRVSYLNNTRNIQALNLILKSLEQKNIPVIPLKGIGLVENVYRDPGVRSMRDIDLLVSRDHLAGALDVLQTLGYKSKYRFDIEQECQTMHHLPSLYSGMGSVVELHWTLVPPRSPFTIPIDQIWSRAMPAELAQAQVLELVETDLILHLCLHAAYMEYFSSGLRPFCDIAWTVQAYGDQIDWEAFSAQAESWGARRCAWLALKIAQQLLHAPAAEKALEMLQPDEFRVEWLEWATAQVLEPARMGGKLAAVWAPARWPARARVFLRELFPQPYEMRPFYPRLAYGLLWPLAYLKHLGIVLKRNWGPAWKLLRGDSVARAAALQRQRLPYLLRWLGERT